jgi:ribonuclease HI
MEFTCKRCGKPFTLPKSVRERYPGWVPQYCRSCYGHPTGEARDTSPAAQSAAPPAPVAEGEDPVEATVVAVCPELERALDAVLQHHQSGPVDGFFTDGGCSGNPGPGGWGVVQVQDNRVVARRRGEHPSTTNNRMELIALMAAYHMIGPDDEVTLWSDSQLCVNTLNEWAAGWAKRGWRRKGGPIKNLDLVKPLYQLALSRPGARLRWIKAHEGSRWNEYVDLLATWHLK